MKIILPTQNDFSHEDIVREVRQLKHNTRNLDAPGESRLRPKLRPSKDATVAQGMFRLARIFKKRHSLVRSSDEELSAFDILETLRQLLRPPHLDASGWRWLWRSQAGLPGHDAGMIEA